jgi:KDO2-lipid IV(A) lauroyltransferase
LNNLAIAFPGKTEKERLRIAKDFYHNLTDTFIETIKFLHWNIKDVEKRFQADLSGIEEAYKTGRPIHLLGMHNMNWEYVNWGLVKKMKVPFLGIYMPIGNKAFDKIILNMRTRYGTIMLPATDFKNAYLPYIKKSHLLASAADQSPGHPNNSFWVNFFNRPTAFVKGAERGAVALNATIVFGHFYKIKRGHYRIDTTFVTDEAAKLSDGQMTKAFADYVEAAIKSQPANYLWSHRRWKHEWNPAYGPVLS